MTVSVNPQAAQVGKLVIKIVGVAGTGSGGIGAVANPEGVDLLILRSQLFIKASSTGAANLGCGIVADAVTKGTDIVNDLAMASVDGKAYNGNTIQVTAKTEITAPVVWTISKFMTFTGSSTTVGLVAYLFVEYIRLP
jgi:hypothetical protein